MSGFQPKKYRVKCLSLGGRRNQIFTHGEIVNEQNFRFGQAEKLVASGHLEYIDPTKGLKKKFPIGEKITLVIGTMIWKRFDVFQFWCDHIKRLQAECPEIEIIPIAVGSEGVHSERIAKKNGVHYLEHINLPLGKKCNARLKFAKKFNPNYIMFLGSDDIISTSLLKEYIGYMMKGIDIIEVMDLYYYDIESKRAAYCDGYSFGRRKGEPIAVARCIRNIVAMANNWELWSSKKRVSPDGSIYKKLSQFNFTRKQITIKDQHLVLDIKGGGINKFKSEKQNWTLISNQEFLKFIDEKEFQKLTQLCINQ